MTDHPGMGVMIGMLGGNAESVEAHNNAVGKAIRSAVIDKDDRLQLEMSDGSTLVIFDDGQSCCEHRYMRTDDDLSKLTGATFLGAELRAAPNETDEWGEHETQFLIVNTSLGSVTFANHNEHNGYYGGFWVVCRTETPK